MKFMKRVSAELEAVGGAPEEEYLVVQGVRFAFRVHQVISTVLSTQAYNLPLSSSKRPSL